MSAEHTSSTPNTQVRRSQVATAAVPPTFFSLPTAPGSRQVLFQQTAGVIHDEVEDSTVFDSPPRSQDDGVDDMFADREHDDEMLLRNQSIMEAEFPADDQHSDDEGQALPSVGMNVQALPSVAIHGFDSSQSIFRANEMSQGRNAASFPAATMQPLPSVPSVTSNALKGDPFNSMKMEDRMRSNRVPIGHSDLRSDRGASAVKSQVKETSLSNVYHPFVQEPSVAEIQHFDALELRTRGMELNKREAAMLIREEKAKLLADQTRYALFVEGERIKDQAREMANQRQEYLGMVDLSEERMKNAYEQLQSQSAAIQRKQSEMLKMQVKPVNSHALAGAQAVPQHDESQRLWGSSVPKSFTHAPMQGGVESRYFTQQTASSHQPSVRPSQADMLPMTPSMNAMDSKAMLAAIREKLTSASTNPVADVQAADEDVVAQQLEHDSEFQVENRRREKVKQVPDQVVWADGAGFHKFKEYCEVLAHANSWNETDLKWRLETLCAAGGARDNFKQLRTDERFKNDNPMRRLTLRQVWEIIEEIHEPKVEYERQKKVSFEAMRLLPSQDMTEFTRTFEREAVRVNISKLDYVDKFLSKVDEETASRIREHGTEEWASVRKTAINVQESRKRVTKPIVLRAAVAVQQVTAADGDVSMNDIVAENRAQQLKMLANIDRLAVAMERVALVNQIGDDGQIREIRCYECGGPHMVRECPNRQNRNYRQPVQRNNSREGNQYPNRRPFDNRRQQGNGNAPREQVNHADGEAHQQRQDFRQGFGQQDARQNNAYQAGQQGGVQQPPVVVLQGNGERRGANQPPPPIAPRPAA